MEVFETIETVLAVYRFHVEISRLHQSNSNLSFSQKQNRLKVNGIHNKTLAFH